MMPELIKAMLAAVVVMFFSMVRAPAGAAVNVVQGGEAAAVIVLAENPTATAEYAAEELRRHILEATGAGLEIVSEGEVPGGYDSRIYVGETVAAVEQGIEPGGLGPDEAVLLTVGGDLYVLGREDAREDPLSERNSLSGTLFGVYEVIERYLGAVWAWPGELGTYIPSTDSIIIREVLDERFSPSLRWRRKRWGAVANVMRGRTEYSPEVERIAQSKESLLRYGEDLGVYLRRHRMGFTEPKPTVGHFFSGWWQRYGEDNPEWFMLNEDGERGPAPGRGARHVAVCPSNPALHEYIVERWCGDGLVRLGEVDSREFCLCDDCLEWDAPQPSEEELPWFLSREPPSVYSPMCVSDRYARFWKAVHEKAAGKDPDVMVTTFLYFNYFPAPQEVEELPAGIYGEFVPWGDPDITWFPMEEDAFEWVKEQWKGWSDTGMTMAYRPNHLHDGWVMSHVDTRQFGEFFKFAYDHGMQGTDFDSLCGQWAAQGPKLYLHMRLNAKPELEVEEILDEYYSVFGPAEENVREYFGYWEEYNAENARRMSDLFRHIGNRWQRFHLKAHEAYPPESFEPAEEMLGRALKAAAHPNPDYAERVKFLKAGLEHAKLSARLASFFDGQRNIPRDSIRFQRAGKALEELVRFRKEHEDTYISDYYTGGARHEIRRWNIGAVYDSVAYRFSGEVDEVLDEAPSFSAVSVPPQLAEELPRLRFRRSHHFIFKTPREETVEIGIHSIATGDAVNYSVFDSEGDMAASGSIEDSGTVSFSARENEVYNVVLTTRAIFSVELPEDIPHAVNSRHAPGRGVYFYMHTGPLYFHVPEGIEEFELTLSADRPAYAAAADVYDPVGDKAAELLAAGEDYVSTLRIRSGGKSGIWKVSAPEQVGDEHFYDVHVIFGDELSGYASFGPEKVLIGGK